MRKELYQLGEEVIDIPIPESYVDCIKIIKSDRFRIIGNIDSLPKIILDIFKPFKNTFLFWFRLSQYKGIMYPICRIMLELNARRYQIQIPPKTKIGYGLYIGHGTCMVVNYGTIIGNNVNLSHYLSIGTNHDTPAIIGNNVYIGPHVSIVEDVKIGSGSTIGAGAVVTKDVPKESTVAGVPAKVINSNNPGRYIGNKYEGDI